MGMKQDNEKRLAAVRRAARKAKDPDMRRLWLSHADYFYRRMKNVPPDHHNRRQGPLVHRVC
jgi:hypothetical protein